MTGLGQHRPNFGFLFAGSRHDLGVALAAAQEALPGVELVGASTAGELTERGRTSGGISLLLVSSDEMLHAATMAHGIKSDCDGAASVLCAPVPELAKRAAERYLNASTAVLLMDGISGTGEQLLKSFRKHTRPFQRLIGGAAGDDGKYLATHVGLGGASATESAVALHIFGRTQWAVGVDHGLQPASPRMFVTRASGNVIHEIDGQPAFEVYRRRAEAQGIKLTRENATRYMLLNEIGIYLLDQVHRARAPFFVEEDGSIVLAAEVPESVQICFLNGEPERMLAAARNAAELARKNLNGNRAAGVLIFDCVCRDMIMGDAFEREVEAVKSVFPDTPIGGFLTYGEIARASGRMDGWHNTTAVVVAIPA